MEDPALLDDTRVCMRLNARPCDVQAGRIAGIRDRVEARWFVAWQVRVAVIRMESYGLPPASWLSSPGTCKHE